MAARLQVAEQLGDGVRILKLDTDRHPDISTQLQIQGLPTLVRGSGGKAVGVRRAAVAWGRRSAAARRAVVAPARGCSGRDELP